MPKKPPADRALLDAFWNETVDRTVLPNGLTLLVKPDHAAPLASVQVWVKTGSLHEGSQLGAGLSHYLEHMLFKGTTRRAGPEISSTVQANGGYINAYTTFDRTVYYIDLPSENLDVAVDILADAVLHSTLPPDEVIREKDVILREIAMTKDDPDNRMWESLFSSAFREHPYRHPIIGHKDVFSAVDREALMSYYTERYVPNNMVVVIAGAVTPADARATVEKHFGSAPRARLAPVLVPSEPLQLGPRKAHRFEKVEVVRAALAWAIPGLTDPEAPALDVLATILGSGDSSVLWQEVREKRKLVHSIDASSWNPGTSGLFCISFTCDEGKRPAAEAAIKKILASHRKATAFTEAQVKKAYRQSVVTEINSRKTIGGQAARLGVAEVVVGDLDFSRTYFEQLAAVGRRELAGVVARFLVPSRLTSVSLEPEPSAPAVLTDSGKARAVQADFEEVRLSNGVRIVSQVDRRLPNFSLRLLTFGGPLSEAAKRRGSGALLATLLTKDTRTRAAAAVARRIEEVGGSFNSFSGDNTMGIAGEALPTDIGRVMELIEQGTLEPAFKESTLGTERDAQLAALREEKDDVVTLARRSLRRRFFGRNPFSLGPHGDEAGVAATQPADVAALWKKLLVGDGVVVSVAGDFKPDKLIPKLERFLAQIPKGKALPEGPQFHGPSQVGEFVENQPREQAVVLVGYPGAVLEAPDYYAGEVADEMFSGMASRLFERVRDQKGLAYFVRSGRMACRSAAMFYFIAGTQPGKEREVLDEIYLDVARIQAGDIAAEELRRCQVRLKAGHRKSLQTNASRAMLAAVDTLQGRGPNHSKTFDSLIDAVTAADVAAFARSHLVPARRTQLVVRP